ncbi:MAG: hypothetical protein UZ22_OP11002000686 [Microgenomates bacterium OLB23]|nr:MAG: hypothetical protein UZ22_OP11002000686 [Microgenomates bacterium OLB23]
MALHRLLAVLLRQLYATRRSLDRLTDIFYWPTIDLCIWGLTSAYFQKFALAEGNIFVTIVSGLILWIILYMASNSIAITILADLWDRNLMNVLVSPLSWTEWLTGNVMLSLIKVVLSFLFTMGLTLLLFKISLFSTMALFNTSHCTTHSHQLVDCVYYNRINFALWHAYSNISMGTRSCCVTFFGNLLSA